MRSIPVEILTFNRSAFRTLSDTPKTCSCHNIFPRSFILSFSRGPIRRPCRICAGPFPDSNSTPKCSMTTHFFVTSGNRRASTSSFWTAVSTSSRPTGSRCATSSCRRFLRARIPPHLWTRPSSSEPPPNDFNRSMTQADAEWQQIRPRVSGVGTSFRECLTSGVRSRKLLQRSALLPFRVSGRRGFGRERLGDARILKTCELESLMVEHNIPVDAFRILDEHKTPRSPAGIRVPSIPTLFWRPRRNLSLRS